MRLPRLAASALCLAAALPACLARRTSSLVEGDGVGDEAACGREAFAKQPSLHYFDLRDKILANPAQYPDRLSVLRQLLPEDYRRYFALVYKSRSLQTTATAPRVVFFGSLATPDLIIGVSGEEPPTGSNTGLDIIEYSRSQKRFCFRTIDFDPVSGPTAVDQADCQGCHGQDGRPLWEPFNTWPGFFGSRDGAMADGSGELAKFKTFTQTQRKTGVFALLPGPDTLATSRTEKLTDFVNDAGGGDAASLVRPMPQFTEALNAMNFQRLTRLIKGSDRHDDYKYAVLASLVGCQGIPDFVPASRRANHPLSLPQVLDDTKALIKAADATRETLVNAGNPAALAAVPPPSRELTTPAALDSVVALRYVLENRQDGALGMAEWSMSRLSGAYAFAGSTSGITSLGQVYVQAAFGADAEADVLALAKDPALYDLSARVDQAAHQTRIAGLCELLKSKVPN